MKDLKDWEDFWDRFFAARTLQQCDLARILKVSNGHVSHWTKGDYVMSPTYVSRLIESVPLSHQELAVLIRLSLRDLKFSDASLPHIGAALSEDALSSPGISAGQVQPGYGLVRFHKTLEFTDLFAKLKSGEELLWLDTYCPRYNDFWGELRAALCRGARMRMLVIDPDCLNARYRAKEIEKEDHYPYDKFKAEIQAFTDELKRSLKDLQAMVGTVQCQIRVYADLPCIPMYIIVQDQKPVRGYSSFFLNKASAYFPHIEWRQGQDSLLENMHSYFESKWDDVVAKPDHGGRVAYP